MAELYNVQRDDYKEARKAFETPYKIVRNIKGKHSERTSTEIRGDSDIKWT